MPEITAIAMTDVLSSNISDDKEHAIFTFRNVSGEEYTIALPTNQLTALVELAMLEHGKTELGEKTRSLVVEKVEVAHSSDKGTVALVFTAPNGGRIAHLFNKNQLSRMATLFRALANDNGQTDEQSLPN